MSHTHGSSASRPCNPSKQSTLADVSLTSVQRQFNVELTLDWRKTDICQRKLFTGIPSHYELIPFLLSDCAVLWLKSFGEHLQPFGEHLNLLTGCTLVIGCVVAEVLLRALEMGFWPSWMSSSGLTRWPWPLNLLNTLHGLFPFLIVEDVKMWLN